MKDLAPMAIPRTLGRKERIFSTLAGTWILAKGLRQRSILTPFLAAAGGWLIRRGLTGECRLSARSANSHATTPQREHFKIESSILIARPPEVLYAFWRDFENLTRFMPHLRSVTTAPDGVSHWIVEGPTGTVEWDAEVINEHPGTMIAWQTLPGADVHSAGTVRFESRNDGQHTEVSVVFQIQPSEGLGATLAHVFGDTPHRRLAEDLERFKMVMESEVELAPPV